MAGLKTVDYKVNILYLNKQSSMISALFFDCVITPTE